MSDPGTDEFAAYDFSEFTQDDLQQIDAEISRNHSPKLTIAYETPSLETLKGSHQKKQPIRKSPLHLYRPRGTLSVTDLASPSWCEVQFDYGLRGKRSRPVYERPNSFKSASGKEIKTDKKIASNNDIITTKGKAIHQVLEREVKAEDVMVEVASVEERWALRLVNMLTCLKGIRFDGLTREMPVFGIEDGEIVVGIIDEVVYRPVSADADDGFPAPDPSQARIETYFLAASTGKQTNTRLSLDGSTSVKPHRLHINDTKTRRRPSLPLPEDMLPARLQLMLYYRLLSGLTSSQHPFDFMHFWQAAGVDPLQQFTVRFLAQAGLIAKGDEFQVLNLADLSALWQDTVQQLQIVGVDNQLTLIYRLQPDRKSVV